MATAIGIELVGLVPAAHAVFGFERVGELRIQTGFRQLIP
jgi:hypothetical protein